MQGLDWLCEALTREYYQYIETHALSNVEEAYVLICCLGRFKTCGQLFHSPVAPELVVKAKPERKAIMPLPAADMGDIMKKLSDTISSLHMYLKSRDQPKLNQFCQNCKQYGHFTSYCKQNCNRCGEEGHPFIYFPTLRAPEAKASPSEAKPPKTKSSKPKKETNSSSAKDETYLVESLAAVRSNVAQKHCLSQTVHPYSTPGKTKGSELLKSELANHESQVSGDQPQQQDQHDVPQQAPAAEPYGVPMDKEDGTYNEAPTIEVQKSSALKTSSQKSQQTKKSKSKPVAPFPVVKPPNFSVLKTLTDTPIPISLYNLAEIAPSVRAQMIQ
ncbi:hypothetical protein DSO57_1018690 [Entomophthora muscae]|uniref:Uncharacterized protein n=1 Tax=Entomophthora muscae TaxID=34485 RepID=A0ACC2UE85_9FUNG|nr:hypothetical protein DSO57_1018690 [Entomophthora muscae]